MALQKSNKKGFTLVEVLVAIAITGLVILTVSQMGQLALRLSRVATRQQEAAIVATEAIEAIRYLRDSDWTENINPLISNTPYYLKFDSTYSLTETPEPLINNRFDRTIFVSDVYRDANDDIAVSGTADTSTKKFTVNVSWNNTIATSTESVDFYLTNLF